MSQLVQFVLKDREGKVTTLGYNSLQAVPRPGDLVTIGDGRCFQVARVDWVTSLFEKKEDMRGQFTEHGLFYPTTCVIRLEEGL